MTAKGNPEEAKPLSRKMKLAAKSAFLLGTTTTTAHGPDVSGDCSAVTVTRMKGVSGGRAPAPGAVYVATVSFAVFAGMVPRFPPPPGTPRLLTPFVAVHESSA
jgi:hypothetical protein